MAIKFIPVALQDIRDLLGAHLSTLSSPVDTFFEDHVENSSHYTIHINGIEAGHTSIHKSSMVTQFCLHDAFKRYGQLVFQRIKKMESVQRAFVPTCDEFFLSHALDEHCHIEKQAYFFQCPSDDYPSDDYPSDDYPSDDYPSDESPWSGYPSDEDPVIDDAVLSFRQAEASDVDLIRQTSGDFFDPIAERIKDGELFITSKSDECAGIGVMIQSKFRSEYADIGLFTAESFRHMGVGTATIRYLMQECKRKQKQPVAGCYYYNHFSKRTLEKAGMYSQTRLLKISY